MANRYGQAWPLWRLIKTLNARDIDLDARVAALETSLLTGNFSPTLTADTGTITLDPDFEEGVYFRLGNLVWVWGYLTVASVDSPTGELMIEGLPFPIDSPIASERPTATVQFVNVGSALTPTVDTVMTDGTSLIQVRDTGGNTSGGTQMANHIAATTVVKFNSFYRTV